MNIYGFAMILWVLIGILAKTGWIKPTGIVWLDAVILRAEYSIWDYWKKVGKWMAQAGLIMLLCFSAALTLFVEPGLPSPPEFLATLPRKPLLALLRIPLPEFNR